MSIQRYAQARWTGDLMSGSGRLSTPQSGFMDQTAYSFKTRFGEQKGTNPEELIAAAHAGCFAMALSATLTAAGFPPTTLDVRADVMLDLAPKPQIKRIKLELKATVPNIDPTRFRELATDAERNCPVSKALASVPIELDAELLG